MKVSAALLTILSVASALAVDEDGEKHRKKPCCGCWEEREPILIATQKRFQKLTQDCDYRGALEMSLPDASFSTIDYGCLTECCVDEGSMEQWWSYYTCNDKVYYPVEPVSIRHSGNGTDIYSVTEIVAAGDGTLYAYALNYYWDLQPDCSYKLSFISGNSYNCPAYLPEPVPCEVCEKAGLL